MTHVQNLGHCLRVEAARSDGAALGGQSDAGPCLCCIMAQRQCCLEVAEAFAGGHFQAVRKRGGQSETRCDCVLKSPFKS